MVTPAGITKGAQVARGWEKLAEEGHTVLPQWAVNKYTSNADDLINVIHAEPAKTSSWANRIRPKKPVSKEVKVLGVEYPQTVNEIEPFNSIPETSLNYYNNSIDDMNNLMASLAAYEW